MLMVRLLLFFSMVRYRLILPPNFGNCFNELRQSYSLAMVRIFFQKTDQFQYFTLFCNIRIFCLPVHFLRCHDMSSASERFIFVLVETVFQWRENRQGMDSMETLMFFFRIIHWIFYIPPWRKKKTISTAKHHNLQMKCAPSLACERLLNENCVVIGLKCLREPCVAYTPFVRWQNVHWNGVSTLFYLRHWNGNW